MHSSSFSRTRRAVAGTAAAAAAVLMSSLVAAPAVSAAPVAAPIPSAVAPETSPLELAGGSVQNLGGAVADEVTRGAIPTVLSGQGTGPEKYVALGDSFAAVGRIAPGAWAGGGPVTCVRTDDAYPTVVARELGVGTFVNATCGGATLDDFWEPGRTGAPPQLEALDEDTDLVSMTIGGNDVGFAAVIIACALRPNTAPELHSVVDSATGRISEGFDSSTGCADVIDRQAPAAMEVLDARLDQAYAEIAERSPNARVVSIGYLSAVPEDDQIIRDSPACAPFMAISQEERAKVRGFQDGINQVVRDAAERNGATVVIPDEPGHSMCAPAQDRWVDFLGLETGAVPIHPTTAGQDHVASRVVSALG